MDVSTSLVIDRPRELVAAWAADPDRATQWYANIRSVRWETAPPLAVGSRFAFVAQFLGRTLSYSYEVRELQLPDRMVMSTSQGPFPMRTEYTWTDADAGATRMTLRNSGAPSGFSALLSPLMATAVRRANRADLRRLKAVLESGG